MRVGELTRLELHLAQGPAPLVGAHRLELMLELAQLVERTAAARARLFRILPAQLARGVPHLLRDVAHALAVLALLTAG